VEEELWEETTVGTQVSVESSVKKQKRGTGEERHSPSWVGRVLEEEEQRFAAAVAAAGGVASVSPSPASSA
jgi:hypothetical protein